MTEFQLLAPRSDEDVASLYTEARVEGLGVAHYQSVRCRLFDGGPEGDVMGVFRSVGALIFNKDERRREVRAR